MKRLSKLVSEMAQVQCEEYTDYKKSNYQLHLDNNKIMLKLNVLS